MEKPNQRNQKKKEKNQTSNALALDKPAYPCPVTKEISFIDNTGNGFGASPAQGMTLIQYYVGQALPELIAIFENQDAVNDGKAEGVMGIVIAKAFNYAENVLREYDKRYNAYRNQQSKPSE